MATDRKRARSARDHGPAQTPTVVAEGDAVVGDDARSSTPPRGRALREAEDLSRIAAALEEGGGHLLHAREQYLSHRLVNAAAEFRLSPREQVVAELYARGWEQAEIAAELGRRPWTVRQHLHKAYRKTGARNGPELAWALVVGRLPLDRPAPRSRAPRARARARACPTAG